MSLLGSGVLVNYHNVAPGSHEEFEAWHTHEHVPERVGVPGFLRGRRYRALLQGQPEYYILYETRDPAVLGSAAYHARLDDPTPWTSKMSAKMTYTGRNAGQVMLSSGDAGIGGAAITLANAQEPLVENGAVNGTLRALLDGLLDRWGITAAHLFENDTGISRLNTSEARIRQAQGEDGFDRWIVVVEGLDATRVDATRDALATLFDDAHRVPTYQLQMVLSR
ncbi:MAG: hypothetical protein KDK91_20935 [Gammaproteobacteria bacterium]|nr:hypothetical protein [Gammaproteobacteria bacterium]